MLGSVEFCMTAGPNCAGGGGDGVLPGDSIVKGSFSLDFAGMATDQTQIKFSDLYVRYQSVSGTTLGNSGIGVAGPGLTPFCLEQPCGASPVPGPVAGAGLPALLAGCVALWGLARARRRRNGTA